MEKRKARSLKKLALLAKSYLEPDTTTIQGFKQFLKTWYVLHFNTSYKDPVLLSHTFEELIVLYYVHSLNANPNFLDNLLGVKSEDEEFEEWLQKRMGEDYVSKDDMVNNMVEYEKREKDIAKELPDRIDTDFSMLGISDDRD